MKRYLYLFLLFTFYACESNRQNTREEPLTLDNTASTYELNAKKWEKTKLKETTVNDFAIDKSGRILAACSDGLYYSDDEGSSWTRYNTGEFTESPFLAIEVSSDGELLASADIYGFLFSKDGGESWELRTKGLTHLESRVIKDILVFDSLIFAGTLRQGVFVSDNKGKSWFPANNGVPLIQGLYKPLPERATVYKLFKSNHKIVAHTNAGIEYSHDKGKSWKLARHQGIDDVAMISTVDVKDEYVIAGKMLKEGVFVSGDKAETWKSAGMRGSNLNSVFISNGGFIYAGTNGNGVYRSTDGETWDEFGKGLKKDLLVTCFTCTKKGYILAGTEKGGIYRLADTSPKSGN